MTRDCDPAIIDQTINPHLLRADMPEGSAAMTEADWKNMIVWLEHLRRNYRQLQDTGDANGAGTAFLRRLGSEGAEDGA